MDALQRVLASTAVRKAAILLVVAILAAAMGLPIDSLADFLSVVGK